MTLPRTFRLTTHHDEALVKFTDVKGFKKEDVVKTAIEDPDTFEATALTPERLRRWQRRYGFHTVSAPTPDDPTRLKMVPVFMASHVRRACGELIFRHKGRKARGRKNYPPFKKPMSVERYYEQLAMASSEN